MRMGQGVRTGLGHGGITCVLQTQFSSLNKRRIISNIIFLKSFNSVFCLQYFLIFFFIRFVCLRGRQVRSKCVVLIHVDVYDGNTNTGQLETKPCFLLVVSTKSIALSQPPWAAMANTDERVIASI